METYNDFINFGVGGELKLYSSESILQGGTSELSVNGESWLASQFVKGRSYAASDIRSDGRHLMVSVVGTHEQKLETGTLTPEVSLCIREDGMKQQSFLGMEVGGGLGYTNIYGYRISSNGELLLSDASEIQEWGLSGQLTYDSFGDRLGMLLDISPAWGQSSATKDSALWGRSILSHEFDSSMYTNGAKIGAEIGYGIELWEGESVFTPYGGVALTQNDDDEYSVGSKLNIGNNIEFELEGSRTYQENGTTENEVNLETGIKW